MTIGIGGAAVAGPAGAATAQAPSNQSLGTTLGTVVDNVLIEVDVLEGIILDDLSYCIPPNRVYCTI